MDLQRANYRERQSSRSSIFHSGMQRQDLLGQVSDVGYDVASMNVKDLCHLLLYGNPNESTFANRIILEATISFIKTSGRFK